MPIMKPPFEQLKEKLKEIFQLDRSDLDFGIYRILNIKSAEINNFLDNDLLSQVNDVLDEHQGKDVATLQADLKRAISGAEAAGFDPANAPTVKAVNKQIALLGGNIDERAKVVFSDLYNFFRRYYKDGDFLSLRRYKKDVYALPYEGEEVKLHWANADQYYVKSSEKFGRYVFRAGDKRITLEIAAADTERDNNKANGKTLRYLPQPNEEGKLFTIQGAQMNIRFAYTTDDQRQQETINECTARKLIKEMTKEWQEPLEQPAPTKANESRILLHKHINTFTAKNTFDYFIHKDLRGFLRRELDFYIKNEVMLLDDIEEADASTADVWLGRAFALRKVGHKIIGFLAQMENFQKRIWLKKKFVLQTHYCATLGHLPLATMPKLLAGILGNEAQWAEWKSLGIVRNSDFAGGDTEKNREEFLRENPSLPVDTRHFDKNFQYELLAGYDNLDEACDGVLIHGENFQVINLLQEKYRDVVQCIYIDPPFNTGYDFMFKDQYRFSSWLSFLNDRVLASKNMLSHSGSMFLHLDYNANYYGRCLLNMIYGEHNYVNEIVWRIGWVSGYKTQVDAFVRNHDTIFYYAKNKKDLYFNKSKAKISYQSFERKSIKEEIKKIAEKWSLDCSKIYANKINFKYQDGSVYKIGLKSKSGKYNIEDTWNSSEYEDLNSNKIKRNAAEYTPHGAELTQKPEQLLHRIIELTTNEKDYVMDYYMGSGTSCAVAKKLKRKFIGIDMGDHFYTDCLHRMKKVMFGRSVGVSNITEKVERGMFKYQCIESYEDALDNLQNKPPDAKRTKESKQVMREDYMLHYFLDVETKDSASLLNVESMAAYDKYHLHITREGKTEKMPIDLVETFNYLLGLRVAKMRREREVLMIEGQNPQGDNVLVIWRDANTMSAKQLNEWFRAVEINLHNNEYDIIYINGDNFIESLRLSEEVWKVRSTEKEFRRLMFEDTD